MNQHTTIEAATLASAMALAFGEFEGATKGKSNPAFKSKYADLESVIEAVKPSLVKHGLFFAQVTHEVQGGVCVETVVRHSNGDTMSFGKLFVPASKQDAQGFGSALTYARRYSLMTAFGIAPEDDDGNAAARTAPAARVEQPKADAPPAKTITAADRASIEELAIKAGVTSKAICERAGVASIAALTVEQADAITKKLNLTIKQKPVTVEDVLADEVPY